MLAFRNGCGFSPNMWERRIFSVNNIYN